MDVYIIMKMRHIISYSIIIIILYKCLEHDTIAGLNETIRQISSEIAKEQKQSVTTEPNGSVDPDDELISKCVFT